MKNILLFSLFTMLFGGGLAISKDNSGAAIAPDAKTNILKAKWVSCDCNRVCYFDVEIPFLNSTSPVTFHTRKATKVVINNPTWPHLIDDGGVKYYKLVENILKDNPDVFIQYLGKDGSSNPVVEIFLPDGQNVGSIMRNYKFR